MKIPFVLQMFKYINRMFISALVRSLFDKAANIDDYSLKILQFYTIRTYYSIISIYAVKYLCIYFLNQHTSNHWRHNS